MILLWSRCFDCENFIGLCKKNINGERMPICFAYPKGIPSYLYGWFSEHKRKPKRYRACKFKQVTEESEKARDERNANLPREVRDPRFEARKKEVLAYLKKSFLEENPKGILQDMSESEIKSIQERLVYRVYDDRVAEFLKDENGEFFLRSWPI